MKTRSAVLVEAGCIRLASRDLSPLSPREVLIQVDVTGLCGSDMAVYLGKHAYKRPPIVLGHEFSGTVVQIGSDVTQVRIADRVCAASFSHCEACPACQAGAIHQCRAKRNISHDGWDGSFAEHVVLVENMVHRLPANVDAVRGALVEPLTIGLHAMRTASAVTGRTVAIMGAGSIGLACLMSARRLGAKCVVCLDQGEIKRDLALRLGANGYADALRDDCIEAAIGVLHQPADIVVVASGHSTSLEQASRLVRPGGEVIFVAYGDPVVHFPVNDFLRAEVTVRFSYLSTRSDFDDVIAWMASGQIDPLPLVTHRFPFEQLAHGVALKKDCASAVGKVLFDLNGKVEPAPL